MKRVGYHGARRGRYLVWVLKLSNGNIVLQEVYSGLVSSHHDSISPENVLGIQVCELNIVRKLQ